MGVEQNKIYVLRINGRNHSYHKSLEIAKNKLREKKLFYKVERRCEILKETEVSFEALLHGWDGIYNRVDIKEIELED